LSTTGTAVAGFPTGTGAPAAASFVDSSGHNRLLVAAVAGGNVYTATRTAGPSGAWSTPSPLSAATSDLSMVSFGGKVYLYATTSSGDVREWVYNPATSSFVSASGALAQWADGTTMNASTGIATTVGYAETSPAGGEIFAAVPIATSLGAIEIARRDPATGRWSKLSTATWPASRAFAQAQPGFAYVPSSPSSPSSGRFYLAWNPGPTSSLLMMETQGNSLAAAASGGPRGFAFRDPAVNVINVWQTGEYGIALEYDGRFDANMRGAWTFSGKHQAVFAPVMDNVFNGVLKDQDDYVVLRGNLTCSLRGGACL
jgi:hypothetical protein